jgi:hypothetical protein
MKTYRLIIPVWLAGLTGPGAIAGHLEKVWELQLARVIKEPSDLASLSEHTVLAASFSPTGNRIALIVDLHQSDDRIRSHLIIMGIESPGSEVQQFDVESRARIDEIDWSEQGDVILVNGTLINLRTGTRCASPEGRRFAGPQSLVSASMDVQIPFSNSVSRFSLMGLNCELKESWDVHEPWGIKDTSQARGLLAVARLGSSVKVGAVEYLIVDVQSRKIRQRWPAADFGGGEMRFAENGKSLCSAGGVGGFSERVKGFANCWDVDTGEKTAETHAVEGGAPMATAAKAATAIITDLRYQPYIIMDGGATVQRRRVVWDFKTGQEIASWRPGLQRYLMQLGKDKSDWYSSPFPFAISPNGQYVIEGGNGVMRLYEILR